MKCNVANGSTKSVRRSIFWSFGNCRNTCGIIIFVKTKSETVEISSMLKDFGYNCGSMSGDMSQSQRELIIDYLKSGKIKILVATDRS